LPLLLALYLILSFFAELIDKALGGDLHAREQALLTALRQPGDLTAPIGPPWLAETMRDLSALGGTPVLCLIIAAGALYLFLARQPAKGWYLLGAAAGGAIVTHLLKHGFDRPRPDFLLETTEVFSASLPSGHSMMAAVVYLTVGILVAENQRGYVMKIYIFALAVLITLLVGTSRVYLGAHWPSDVIAGWLGGLAWALLFLLGGKILLLRRRARISAPVTASNSF